MKYAFTCSAMILFSFVSLLAFGNQSKLQLGVSGGYGVVLAPDAFSDVLPASYGVSADLTYMFNSSFGIVPLAFTYQNFMLDDKIKKMNDTYTGEFSLMKANGWLLGYTPGVFIRAAVSDRASFFVQAGAGIFRIKTSTSMYYKQNLDLYPDGSGRYALVNFGAKAGANEFGVQLGGGMEFRMSEKYSLTGKVRYNWINTEESLSVIDFNGGVKLHF